MKKTFLTLLCFFFLSFSFAQFNPNPCITASSFTIVVIGSSTAAGAGPSTQDSAWVWRYRDYLQKINPNNQVINLAVGGYVTYRLMPDNFVPPANRPTPNIDHNITKALSYNPDAIIINLPSNDRQYPMMEQLDNFDSLYRHSLNNGVPMWITTTQPVNSGPVAYQTAVRDSIFARYGTHAIDFWTTIADPVTGFIDSIYNKDGTHLNDAGHRILVNRIIGADILTDIYSPFPTPDIGLQWVETISESACGDSLTEITIRATNFGTAFTQPISVDASYLHFTPPTQSGSAGTVVLSNGLTACQTDTVSFYVNTYDGGAFQININHTVTDANPANDMLTDTLFYKGHPDISVIGDTGCINTSVVLSALASPEDSIMWYDQPAGGNLLAGGATFTTPPLSQTTTYYAQATRGSLTFEESLTTTSISNINWNGTMFDIVGLNALTIDSFSMKINTLGMQGVEVFYKTGSYLGHEDTVTSWTLLGTDMVSVTDPDAFVAIHPGAFTLSMGDTVGIHIRMQNPASRLSYRSAGATLQVSTPEMEIRLGSGISYNFAATYYPRQWNGTVHYHFGNRPEGDCQTDRIPVTANIDDAPLLDLGPDLMDCESAEIMALPGFQYRWSTGENSQSIMVTENGTYWLEISNECGNAIDAIYVTIDSMPVADFSFIAGGSSVGFSNMSTGGRSFAWDFGDGNTSLAESPIHSFSTSGTYSVSLIVTNACGSDTITQSVDVLTTDLNSTLEDTPFSLYPNPTTGSCMLSGDIGLHQVSHISIYEISGKQLHGIHFEKRNAGKWKIDLEGTSKGMYFVKIKSQSGETVLPLIVQ